MNTDSTVQLVEDRIANDQTVASEIAAKLTPVERTWTGEDIRLFFPEYQTDFGKQRSNLPRGMRLAHHLLVASPPVFDVEPIVTRSSFADRYGFTLQAVEELAESGRILPNLYVRNPSQWQGKKHMEPLLRSSISNGERVDAYLRARDPRYNDHVTCRTEDIEVALRALEKVDSDAAKTFVAGSRSSREDAPRTVATRWAYLDVLEPEASERVEVQLKNGKLLDAAELILLSKHLYVSPISASIGGEFIWPNEDLAMVKRLTEGCVSPNVSGVAFQGQKERLEFLVSKVTGVRPFQVLNAYDQGKLVSLLKNEEFHTLKGKVRECIAAMSKLVQIGEVSDDSVDEWSRLAMEIQHMHDTTVLRTKEGANIGLATGFAIDPTMAIGMGFVAYMLQPKLIEGLGSTIYKMANPEKHRFMMSLHSLKKQ